MTISFVAGGSAAANTVALPALQLGDTILGIGQAPAAGAVTITVPAGWYSQRVAALANGRSYAWAYRVVDTTAFSFGTWTTAEKTTYVIFRGSEGIVVPLDMPKAPTTAASNTSGNIPSINSNVFAACPHDVRVALFSSCSLVNNGIEIASSGFTQIHRSTLASHDQVLELSDSLVSSFAGITRTLTDNSANISTSWGLLEIPKSYPIDSGGISRLINSGLIRGVVS